MTENSPMPPSDTHASSDWVFDHVGHAVHDLEAAIATYRDRAGFSLVEQEELPEHLVRAAFLTGPGRPAEASTLIELIQPLPGNTTLARFLERRGESLHHVCYRVTSVDAELLRLSARGVSLIDATARRGSRGMDVAFLHPKSFHGALVELCSPSR